MVYTALRLSVVAAATAMALAGGTGIGSATGPPYPDPGRCARPRPPLCRDVRRGGQPPSWIDPLVLASVLPQSFHLVAAEVLEHQGLNGLVFRRLGHQFVERHEREHGVADADRLATPMRGGRSPVIFPEGGLVRPRVTPFPHGRIRGGRPNRRARCPGGYPRDADSICGQSTISHDAKPSTSPLVSRSGIQAQTGLRRLNCSMPRETRLCASRGSRTSNDK